MENIIPYQQTKAVCTTSLNLEKLKPMKDLGPVGNLVYSTIRTEFNSNISAEKMLFYDGWHKIPNSSYIGYTEICDSIPNYIYAVRRSNTAMRFVVKELNESVLCALKSTLYSKIIRDFDKDLDTISVVIKGFLPVKSYFIIVKITNKETLIKGAKKEWNNIISSTRLAGTSSILNHYDEMKEFYYRVVENKKHVYSVYQFIEDNKHLMNHILPTLTLSVKSYNNKVMQYVREHIKLCMEANDYNIGFNESQLKDCINGDEISADISTAINNDVKTKLNELKHHKSELDVLKKEIIRCKDGKLSSHIPKLSLNTDEMISYSPGKNIDEDIFYYGLPENLGIVIDRIESSMRKSIHCELDIDSIDYMPEYPFTQKFKKLIYDQYKSINTNIKMSHLGLHYSCLYIYLSHISKVRSNFEEHTYDKEILERARTFAKVNIASLRSIMLDVQSINKIAMKPISINWQSRN
ncbi:putative p5 protein [Pueraria lobata-associated emaravirus]|uniref:P5 protein n=1 Tax=Pueraria lobata-associated emaravirus TaxID=2944626 RepID=A0AAE9HUA7_9VIRU|nr:putative p5 protein [Pueraria lobata-associated emaravirus]